MREFDTSDYEMVNGRKPRGTRNWALVPADYIYPKNRMPYDAIAWSWGSYSDAKRDAATRFPEVKVWRVMP